ncbi:CBS domain-containing protein [Aquisalinus flavus]|uniref:Inosine-5-monophosphate dehydrogenase n=1 Tax=Aquisalinus flavus TaxID=1526572 RepID=A0A8J2V2K8_9PROT|nr:CBS domain-containing protein [Aquisalinus flavus]MBD0426029.1 CBS domain-containing protein [Aquisalinus flavus]GGD11287.1 inosine-5-monophosphate dehydrogenase [Aquisalinus flavus]
MLVKDAMTAGIRIAEPDELLPHAAKKMRTQNIGALPVVEGGRLVGMITDRDIAVRAVGSHKDIPVTKVKEIMSEECIWCAENAQLEDAIRIMEQNQVRRLPVMNDDHRIVGMLSIEDIALFAPVSLVGEVMKAVAIRNRDLLDSEPVTTRSIRQ